MNSRIVTNFGGNQRFRPAAVYQPRSEAELLHVLRACQGRHIRVVGRLHSWSEAAVSEDVLIDLRMLDDVRMQDRDGQIWVSAGGGCQIKRLLRELKRQANCTLPSLGLITEQSIAGAISTGTHGSGRPSMSHFMEEIRIATYDPATGEPVIRAIRGGEELRAARCSLGAMGVIVSVGFYARPSYRAEEQFVEHKDLASVLAAEETYPLQQFFLMPWWWKYLSQQRRETTEPRGGWASLYRLYFFLQFDIGLHLLVRLAARTLRSRRLIRLMFEHATPRLVVRNWRVIDDSNQMLVMEHEWFQHIECEVFVVRSRLAEALKFVEQLIRAFDGERDAIDSANRAALERIGLLEELDAQCGSYTHHYPICVRRVLPDDALISMTSGNDEPAYALSFISYERPRDRRGFMAFAEMLSRSLAAIYGGRLHWGKVCPLSADEVCKLYPRLPRFREVCRQFDPSGAFRNEWVQRTLFE